LSARWPRPHGNRGVERTEGGKDYEESKEEAGEEVSKKTEAKKKVLGVF
jgi:hypothetical protein